MHGCALFGFFDAERYLALSICAGEGARGPVFERWVCVASVAASGGRERRLWVDAGDVGGLW